MDTIRLRTLSYKSSLGFGTYKEMSVQQLIDLRKTRYLRHVYYRYEGISFVKEILREIYINEEDEIIKPGSDLKKMEEVDLKCYERTGGITKKIMKNKRKRTHKIRSIKMEMVFANKGKLQKYNHGHNA